MVIRDYILARLHEPSTWRGLFLLATALGVSISPEQQTAILSAGMAVVGAIGAFVPDR